MKRKTKFWLYSVSALLTASAGAYGSMGQTGVLNALRTGTGWTLLSTMEGLMKLVDLLLSLYQWTWE